MATPPFKIYRSGEYVASCKYAEDAATLIGVSGTGQIKYNHKLVVWREGSEVVAAGDSYDLAADIMRRRIKEYERECRVKLQEQQDREERRFARWADNNTRHLRRN